MANLTDGRGGKYFLLGVDWEEKRWGIPTWGWAAALAAAGYYFFIRK
jgi:hypothetical protein